MTNPPTRAKMRRHDALFNTTTGLSERPPYNTIDLRLVNWPRWARILFFFLFYPLLWLSESARYIRARFRTWRYYVRIIRDKYELDAVGAIHLGRDARKSVQRYLTERARDDVSRLVHADDMTYLLIRGLPTVSPFMAYPNDEAFPEKDRDAEHVRNRLEGTTQRGDPNYVNASITQRGAKRAMLDRKFRHADFLIAGLAALLNCKIWSRYENGAFARNMLTDPGEQQSSDLDNIDMALRFAQSTVEKNLPTAPIPTNDESCAYRIYLCVKNWLRVPVYLITVQEIVDEYLCRHNPQNKARTLATLQSPQFVRRGPRFDANQTLISMDALERCAVLRPDFLRRDGWIMAFDHERVQPMAEAPEQEEALLELREAIRRARRDAITIRLKPGDVLVVDNLRALVSRRDYLPATFRDVLRFIPTFLRITREAKDRVDTTARIRIVRFWPLRPFRWLRSYYAFRVAGH